ncbi:MAG: tRNA methyltransferase ppm2 [Sclerophora amabilis]|nr:MAG: tRNA methyltransferase ppm2 [Sclerophora amabilis]
MQNREREKLPTRSREKQDVSVMETNNSSIVSKRSVERLYFSNESHFFRYFVKKPQRRSPLINRGYWLRMKAIDFAVKEFLESSPGRRKVVINLGCGYDPLPFQCLARYPHLCHNAKFVDVDYPQLIERKCDIIEQTEQLVNLFSRPERLEFKGPVAFRSDQYLALGCDLRDLTTLHHALAEQVDLRDCELLFTAEVSLTYMNTEASDAVIKWAATLNQARFCLLEQILPDGKDQPFAQTMIRHFKKLQTPLHPIQKYPTLDDQKRRFQASGWAVPAARDLWSLWHDDSFLSPEERILLNAVEPFDEWEEFAQFASHYFMLYADNTGASLPKLAGRPTKSSGTPDATAKIPFPASADTAMSITFQENPKKLGLRRFGSAFGLRDGAVAVHGGMGSASRLDTSDVIGNESTNAGYSIKVSGLVPPRMCHTITTLGNGKHLMVGGRKSPEVALGDCWLHALEGQTWQAVDELDVPRYRHCATGVGVENVLVFGGKDSAGRALTEWLLWTERSGWQKVEINGAQPQARFGASMVATRSNEGILFGGMTEAGTILCESWEWSMDLENVRITFRNRSDELATSLEGRQCYGRFGAAVSQSQWGLTIIGGVSQSPLLNEENEIMIIKPGRSPVRSLRQPGFSPRPLLVGHSVHTTKDSILIFGGGAVCFSFGTHWNNGIWALTDQERTHHSWRFREEIAPGRYVPKDEKLGDGGDPAKKNHPPIPVPRIRISSARDFDDVVREAQPVIIEGLNVGECTNNWTSNEYLKDKVGTDRAITVHRATSRNMSFQQKQQKNFSYETMSLGSFLDEISGGAPLYLRSLSSEKPSEKPAELSQDFPALSPDWRLPDQLQVVKEHAHSSPLRISGPVNMWLHYDVMANVLVQIRSSKHLILYPPTDAVSLSFPPGSTTSPVNPFTDSDKIIANTHPQMAELHPSDVLFIPPLWPHCASPTSATSSSRTSPISTSASTGSPAPGATPRGTSEPSISVNVFFRSLASQHYSVGRDVYGNRDLVAYERGRVDVDRIAKRFEGLPGSIRAAYLRRLGAELITDADGQQE